MTRYRLTYPAHLYCSVCAESFEEARDQLVDCLKEIHDGMEVTLDEDLGDEVLYPDSNSAGEIDPELVLVEDVEQHEGNHERSPCDEGRTKTDEALPKRKAFLDRWLKKHEWLTHELDVSPFRKSLPI
jgi:hypothetical protein